MKKQFKKALTRQQGQSDCGVACLLWIIRYYGGNASQQKLRELSGTTQQGTTLLGLYQAALQVGFDASGCEADMESLKKHPEPCILHVVMGNSLHHYIVVLGFDQQLQQFIVGDPGTGISYYAEEELDKIWQSKKLLVLTPNDQFIKQEIQHQKQLTWLTALLREDQNILYTSLAIGSVIAILGLSTAIFTQRLIDEILPSGKHLQFIGGTFLFAFLLSVRAGLRYLRGVLLNRQSRDFNNRIISKFFTSLVHLPKLFFDSRKTGELIARINDTRRIQSTINTIVSNLIIDLLIIVVSLALTFIYNFYISIITAVISAGYLLIAWKYNFSIRQSQQETMAAFAHNESNYIEVLQGIDTIKASNKELLFSLKAQKIYERFQDKNYHLNEIAVHFQLWNELAGVVLVTGAVCIGGYMVLNKTLQIGEMVAILTTLSGFIPAISRLSTTNIQLQEARVAFERMFELVDIKPEYAPTEEALSTREESIEKIIVSNLSFRFPGRRPLLHNVSFDLCKGEMIVLIGESGCGKSTLMQILQRFYPYERGTILLNQRQWETTGISEWRNRIAVVSQEVAIFSGTLLENICLNAESHQKEEVEKVIKFCRELGFSTYFETFPQSYFTLLGEEGVKLSGGQKQLVAFARALYRHYSNPRVEVLLLDEPTSAMDRQTENFVMSLLNRIKNEMLVLMITHRLRTTQHADRVYVIKDGVAIEQISALHEQINNLTA